MPPKRCRHEDPSLQPNAAGERKEAFFASLNDAVAAAVKATTEETFEELEQERKQAKTERVRLLVDAREVAAKVTADADKMHLDLQTSRTELDAERAAMHHAHTFQTSKLHLDVGGFKFTTSLQTLTSVPDTYLASLFSGRFELTPDAEGSYFIDREGRYFDHILNYLRDPESFELSSDLTAGQKKALTVEMQFFGLFDHMIPSPCIAPPPWSTSTRCGSPI
jgi:hypothetical protein